jgi:saposin
LGLTNQNSINVEDHVDVHIDASPKCELCQYVILQLQSYLDSPKTEHDIEKFVEDLCDKYLPKEMSSQCEEFVTNYGEQLIELIGEEVDPKEVNE